MDTYSSKSLSVLRMLCSVKARNPIQTTIGSVFSTRPIPSSEFAVISFILCFILGYSCYPNQSQIFLISAIILYDFIESQILGKKTTHCFYDCLSKSDVTLY